MKRLRENAMLEAEISVNGDVFVEGHHVGQLAGFRFTLVSGTEGPDAKAVQAAAQKALALEFEARAARLHAAGNGDLALGSDGTVRWLGDPVARLAASDHIMRPRVILLSDEQLTGNARDHVAARIERFVNHHIATVLKPLDDLSRAEDLQGLAKGLAFQLVENLGVLFRRDVADDVKSLDQDGRASMRKHGIRFGAYHIFMPALLKPAPAELITLLWALKNDGLDKPGYGDLIPVLAAGRTSVVTDPSYERTFYKLAGFRFLGKRAVRIDILERLADLIRPLLQWKPGTPRPDGAYDGRRFTATTAMLSILGATPDDMEEILKGLGYRADSVTAEEAAAFLAAQAPADAGAATPADAAGEQDGDADEAQADAAEETAGEAPAAEAPASETPVEETPATETAEAPAASDAAAPEAAGESAEPVEAKPVLLWRPGSRHDNQRQGGHRHGGERSERGERRGGDRNRGQQAGERGERGERREGGRGRPDQNRGGRDGKPQGGNRDRNEQRNERGGKPQQAKFEARPPRKEKPIDPDSPFAKLAALKEQLKK
jgi:ATP-dependent RNA helicase SUPV3L1/SUV3